MAFNGIGMYFITHQPVVTATKLGDMILIFHYSITEKECKKRSLQLTD
jgi:hypothetical protein